MCALTYIFGRRRRFAGPRVHHQRGGYVHTSGLKAIVDGETQNAHQKRVLGLAEHAEGAYEALVSVRITRHGDSTGPLYVHVYQHVPRFPKV
jgi:hypothetical protein